MNTEGKNIVSVFMLVYNQEKYIEQTLDSILQQNTNFPFNIVIGEDCSTDNSKGILEEYLEKYPGKIKIIHSNENVGLMGNFIRTIRECDGKYIAICDGDDYWIDENKLQIQVDFLEQHPDFSIVFTNKNDLYKDGKIVVSKAENPSVSGFKDIIKGNYIASVTSLFRNTFYKRELPNWFIKYPYGDWPIYLMVVNDGSKIKFFNTITANYRKDVGISAGLRKKPSDVTLINLSILKDIFKDAYFESNKDYVYKSILQHKIQLMMHYNRDKEYFKSFIVYLQLLFKINIFQLKKHYLYSLVKSFK